MRVWDLDRPETCVASLGRSLSAQFSNAPVKSLIFRANPQSLVILFPLPLVFSLLPPLSPLSPSSSLPPPLLSLSFVPRSFSSHSLIQIATHSNCVQVLGWQPAVCFDSLDMAWSPSVVDTNIASDKFFGCCASQENIQVWLAPLSVSFLCLPTSFASSLPPILPFFLLPCTIPLPLIPFTGVFLPMLYIFFRISRRTRTTPKARAHKEPRM